LDNFTLYIFKLAHLFVTPLGVCTSLWLLAIVLFLLKRTTTVSVRIFSILPVFVLWFCATPITSQWMQDTYTNAANLPVCTNTSACQYQAIIVAGWLQPYEIDDPTINRFWSDRLWAAKLAYRPDTPIIVVSSQFPTPPEPDIGMELSYAEIRLEEWDISKKNRIISKAGRSTLEAMQSALNEARSLNASKILLIGYRHRVVRKYASLMKLIKQAQLDIQVQVSFAGHPNKRLELTKIHNWIPKEEYLIQSKHTFHEIAGLIAYKLTGLAKT